MKWLVSPWIIGEIAALNLVIFLFIRKKCDSISRSFCYSGIITLAALSLSIQVLFLMKIPHWSFLMDIAITGFSIFHIVKNKKLVQTDTLRVFNFLRGNRLILFVLIPILLYLFLQAFLLPPSNPDSMVYNLARVLMFQQEKTIFLENYSSFHQVAFPVGHDILSFLFLRFHSDFGLAIYSFIAYLLVISGTYSLIAQFYPGDKKLGVTGSMIIASLTLLVLQATTAKNDIPCAASAVVIFLAGYHFFIESKRLELYVMIVGFLFGLSIKDYFGGFAFPFFLLFALLLIKNRSFRGFIKSIPIKPMRPGFAVILPLGLILCLGLFYHNNYKRFGNFWGEEEIVKAHQNRDGFIGGAANMGRYLVQAAEIPIKYGYKLNDFHDRLLKEKKSAGIKDTYESPDLAMKPFISEDYSWYGPLGFFLVIPSIFWSIFFARGKENGYVRVVALSLLSFFVLVSFKVSWMPWNCRFFSLFFAGAGLPAAFVLNTFTRNKKIIRGLIVIVAIYGLLSAALQNDRKLTVPKYHSLNLVYNIYKSGEEWMKRENSPKKWFTWLDHVSNRGSHYAKLFSPHMLDSFVSRIERGKKVLIVGFFSPVFPLMFSRPDLDITVSKINVVSINHRLYFAYNRYDYKFIRKYYDYIVFADRDVKRLKLYDRIREEEEVFYSKKGSIFRFGKKH